MKTIGFIFARGGSKGLPGKNLMSFGGKPLIAWSIEHAYSIKRIDRLIVSTDSEEIAATALSYGAEVPFMRPDSLARDDSPEWFAWRHALNYLINNTGGLPEVMVSIPTTAPLRLPSDIENCLDLYHGGGVDVVITVTEAHRSPFFNMVTIDLNGSANLVNPPIEVVTRRQDAPPVFDMATVCYVVNPKFVMSHQNIFDGRVKAVHVDRENAIDIDTLLDFQIAESILNIRNKKLGI
jgi:N-acylneuraminate cytidylyltransferase